MAWTYKDYTESDKVRKLSTDLAAHEQAKPAEWTGGQYGDAMNQALNKIQNREKFSYDLNGDALYQQYKDKYVNLGRQAMMDSMGQAAALTGGYGSTYGQSVGQQQYDAYLQSLNDVVPELYQMAYDRYNQEGQDLYNQYGLLADQYNSEYGRYRDAIGDWQNQRNYLTNQYNAERNFDYGQYGDAKNYAYTDYRNSVADQQWAQQMAFQRERAAAQDAQWQAEFNLAQQKAAGGGSSGGSGGGSYNSDTADIQRQLNAMGASLDVDGVWGPKTQAAYEKYMLGSIPANPVTHITGTTPNTSRTSFSYDPDEGIFVYAGKAYSNMDAVKNAINNANLSDAEFATVKAKAESQTGVKWPSLR